VTGRPEPSAAQRPVGDIAPKLAQLTDDVLFGDVRVFAEDRDGA
jgi:4-carboxymuconolactone decarboxylase